MFIKMLPMPDVFSYDKELFFKCSSERMNMLGSPSKSQGIKVILTRNVSCYKKGQVGIARKFNPVDIFQNIKSYNEAIFWNGKLPDLNHSYDFHPIVTHNDKKIVSVWHTHISVFDFEEIN